MQNNIFFKKILSSVYYWVFVSSVFLDLQWTSASESSHKQILTHLSQPDREALDTFLKVMLTSSEGGYVLYGNKPICFQTMSFGDSDPLGSMDHHMSTLLSIGISTWEKVGLPKSSKKYILHISQSKNLLGIWQRILLINRAAYYQAVNENIVLFKYVLGPKLTPESLLEQLTSPVNDFYSVLKNDKVLVGILLGFGVNNALFVNREELLGEPLEEHSQNNLMPSFGYSSLEEESADLQQKIMLSSSRLEKYFPRLYVGHVPNNDKGTLNNVELIKDFEDVQIKVQEILTSEFFLENVLEEFYK